MELIVAIVKYGNHLSKKTVCLSIILVLLLKEDGIAQAPIQQPVTRSQTTGEAVLTLTPDRKSIIAGGDDLSFITVRITDKNGATIPDAHNKVTLIIEGTRKIVATDNGDPANLISFAAKERDAYFGLLLIIVASEKDKAGTIKLTASSSGLKPAIIAISSK